jgi:hypothetical protein
MKLIILRIKETVADKIGGNLGERFPSAASFPQPRERLNKSKK